MDNKDISAGEVLGYTGKGILKLAIYVGGYGCQCVFLVVNNGHAACVDDLSGDVMSLNYE